MGNLCPKFASGQCDGNGSRLIRIRQIKPIEFENITSSRDGSTTLTLVTNGPKGFKVYKFILKKGRGTPDFNHLKITPDPEKTPLTLIDESLSEEELERARRRWKRRVCQSTSAVSRNLLCNGNEIKKGEGGEERSEVVRDLGDFVGESNRFVYKFHTNWGANS